MLGTDDDVVEIRANNCIDRGSIGDTRFCEGARLDNLVHIAHNVYVGRHAAVIADAMIGGGTRIGMEAGLPQVHVYATVFPSETAQ